MEGYGGDARAATETVMPYLHMPVAHLDGQGAEVAAGGNDWDWMGFAARSGCAAPAP